MLPDRFSSARITLSALVAFALLPALLIDNAFALYPERIVRIVVPFAPGGGTDVIARTLAQEMARDLGVAVVIENKPGGQGPLSEPRPWQSARRMATRC